MQNWFRVVTKPTSYLEMVKKRHENVKKYPGILGIKKKRGMDQ